MSRVKLPIAVAASMVAISGCGSGDSDPDQNPSARETETSATSEPTGPEGTLTATSFGSVEQGTEINEVVDLWGDPDQRNRYPGCEIDPNSSPVIVHTWNVADGDVGTTFDANTERLDSYRTSSRRFPTSSGVRIGDKFAVVKGTEGSTLQALSLGLESTERDGFWLTGDIGCAAQLFTIAGGKITTISGGYLPPCE